MNPLMNLIKEVEPGYPEPFSDETTTIYCHQQASIKELIEFGRRPVCAFVGMTKTSRGFGRFVRDRDYSHLPEKVTPDLMIPVHKDITDHYVRAELYSLGFRKTTLGGSNEVVESPLHIKTYSEMISLIRSIVLKIDERFKEYQKTFGFTPESHKKLIKEKNPEATRAPKLHLVNLIVEKLNNLPKDAKIYVPQDAFGHFSITLSNRGYSNIFTDIDYEMNPTGMSNIPDSIKYITTEEYEDMDFDAVIGNPPYGKGGKLALRFLNSAADRVREKKGQIILVLPKSVKQGSANYNKISRELELVWTKDCEDKDFASSIDACIQEWKIGDKPRDLDLVYKEHPHIEFLKYEQRYDADIFVGGDGGGASGKVFLPGEKNEGGKEWTDYEKSSSHNYIRVRPDEKTSKDEILRRIISLGQNGDNTFRKTSMETTNGIPHLGKTKLITIYTNRYGNGHE